MNGSFLPVDLQSSISTSFRCSPMQSLVASTALDLSVRFMRLTDDVLTRPVLEPVVPGPMFAGFERPQLRENTSLHLVCFSSVASPSICLPPLSENLIYASNAIECSFS